MGSKEAVSRLERISETAQALGKNHSGRSGSLSAADHQGLADATKLLILDLQCLLAELGEDFRQKLPQ